MQGNVTAFAIEGPVWLPATAPASSLYPPQSSARRAKVLLLGASVESRGAAGKQAQAAGWLSRSIPLSLAESAFVLLALDTVSLLPWSARHGFAVLPQPWREEEASALAHKVGAAACLATHVVAKPEAAVVSARLLRTHPEHRPAELAEWTCEVAWNRPDGAWVGMWARAASALAAEFGDAPDVPDPARYRLPGGAALPTYLRALEQVGGLRCQGSEAPGAVPLPGQHAAVRSCLALAQAHPESLPVRLLLHEALLRMRGLDGNYTAGLELEIRALDRNAAFTDPAVAGALQHQIRMIYGR